MENTEAVPYEPPQVVDLGTLAELTRGPSTGSRNDNFALTDVAS